MSHRSVLFILLFLLLAQASVLAQAAHPVSDTLRWNASGFTDVNTQVQVTKACHFITYGSNQIEWVQRGGALVYTLTVTSVTGSWPDTGSDGTLTYHVVQGQFTGTVTLQRAGGIFTLQLDLAATDHINNLYTISHLDLL